jgi:hypothetical protein
MKAFESHIMIIIIDTFFYYIEDIKAFESHWYKIRALQ